ncbi:alpha/beta fold hydrolase [Alkalimonas mucilaginosa]|uniref:Alpha/beta hydrolase n=1 Tax=Alkalimonas mucilaginosa TaxID=3057676 RepID=A0ABU7JIR4_9GAMM|nr:alpha/beta hydrolase [Alkalimonas sp. MEB004]MEE2025592.1 alpha/beta hydrolase [Alkalimonas sp. MEB004]
MELIPWSFHTHYGFCLRGYHSAPSGKPVLHVLHGNGFCSRMYQPMLQQLARDYDLFLSDAQGHGDSDHGGPFVGWNESAELAAQAWLAHRDRFANVPHIGLGHSFGGVLTALNNAAYPDLFSQVVLLDPVLFTPSMLTSMKALTLVRLYQRNPYARAALKRRQHWPDKITAKNYLQQRGLYRNWQPEALAAYIDHALKPTEHGISLKCQPEREAEIFGSYPRNLWRQLAKPCAPTLVLYGNNSYPFVPKALQKWQHLNPAVELEQLPGSHCFMQEAPEMTATAIHAKLSAIKCV